MAKRVAEAWTRRHRTSDWHVWLLPPAGAAFALGALAALHVLFPQ